MNKLMVELKCLWARWNLVDRLLAFVVIFALIALVLWSLSCSTPAQRNAIARSVEVGGAWGEGSGGIDSHGGYGGHSDFDGTSRALLVSVHPLAGLGLEEEAERRLTDTQYAALIEMSGKVGALQAKLDASSPPAVVKHEEPPPPEEPAEKILGMSPALFTTILIAIAGSVAAWQRERIGKTVRKIAGKKES